jgi:hypothetical protein
LRIELTARLYLLLLLELLQAFLRERPEPAVNRPGIDALVLEGLLDLLDRVGRVRLLLRALRLLPALRLPLALLLALRLRHRGAVTAARRALLPRVAGRERASRQRGGHCYHDSFQFHLDFLFHG